MRIGTWNLDNRWGARHSDLIRKLDCDVWLLTEVNPKAENPRGRIAGFHCHLSSGVMVRKQHYAAVLSRGLLSNRSNPHAASAAATVNGIVFCSTILPFARCREYLPHPWNGKTIGEMTKAVIESLSNALPSCGVVWGGDWNHSLEGRVLGSKVGREHVLAAIKSFDLQVPTADLPHRIKGCRSIDHVAVPSGWMLKNAEPIPAKGLSDHDAYVIDVDEPKRGRLNPTIVAS